MDGTLDQNQMRKKMKNKKSIILICFLISLLFNCTDKKQTSIEKEVNMFEHSDLGYSINIKDNRTSISFLLDQDKEIIDVLVYKDKKYVKDFPLKIDKSKIYSFIKIVNHQLKPENVFKQNKNNSGFDVNFTIGRGRDDLSAFYPHVLNFEEDISIEFNKLISFLKKEKLISEFLDKNN